MYISVEIIVLFSFIQNSASLSPRLSTRIHGYRDNRAWRQSSTDSFLSSSFSSAIESKRLFRELDSCFIQFSRIYFLDFACLISVGMSSVVGEWIFSVVFRLSQQVPPQRQPARTEHGRAPASKLRQHPQSDRSRARRTCQSLALRQPPGSRIQSEAGSAEPEVDAALRKHH